MEKWQEWRKEASEKLTSIEDHEERRGVLAELKNSNEYKESIEEKRDLNIVIDNIAAKLCRGSVTNALDKKQYGNIQENHHSQLISTLKKQITYLLGKTEHYYFHPDAIIKLKKEFPEINNFLQSPEIKDKYYAKTVESIEKDLEYNTPGNSGEFDPFKKILEIKNRITDVKESSDISEEDYIKIIKNIEKNIFKYISDTRYLYLVHNFDGFMKTIEEFPELKEFVKSTEVKESADKIAQEALYHPYIDEMLKICEYFKLQPERYEVAEADAIHILHTLYLDEKFEQADKVMQMYPEARDYFTESGSLLSLIGTYLEESKYDFAAEICRIFKIPSKKVFKEVKETFKMFLTKTPDELSFEGFIDEEEIEERGGTTSIALEILSNFEWEEKDMKPFFVLAMEILLKGDSTESIEKVIDYFNGKVDIDEIKKNKKFNYTGWLINADISTDILLTKKIFTTLKIKREEAEEMFNSPDISFINKFTLNTIVSPPFDKDMDKCYQLFGFNTSEDIYIKIKDLIYSGKIAEELSILGVTEVGEKGFEQLRKNFHKIKESWFSNNPNIEAIKSSELVQKFFMNYVDYKIEGEDEEDEEEYGWGDHDQESFDRTIKSYEEVGRISKMPPEYMIPSGNIEIDRVDRKAKIEWSEQFSSRYHQLLGSIKESSELIDKEKKPLSILAEEIQEEYTKIINSLKERLNYITNEKAKIGMEERIKSLESINVRNIEDFQKNFTFLSKFRELHPLLRKVIFTFSMLKNKGQKERIAELYGKSPDLDTVTTILDFADHITNQETMSEYFTDKQGRDAFKEIAGTKAIQEELSRTQNRKVVGKTTMQFVPVRNVLTEFSGHIADACWASEYESILRDFPNFTSVIFVRDPGEVGEKLAGACFLIESETKEGDKLLIIRGLNPTQNVINGLSISDFFNKFKQYIKDIADKDGRKVALVVDSHSGGAGTNRPNLYSYMSDLNLPPIRLKTAEDTEFNGYDITDMCVAIN